MSRHDSDHDEDEEFENLGDSRDQQDEDSDLDDSYKRSGSSKQSSKGRSHKKRDYDDDDDDDEEDEDDEDEEDEDDGDNVSRRRKKSKRNVNPFLDMEAEVDDEEEDEDEEDDEYGAGDGFIADEQDEAAEATRASKHLDLDRKRREEDDVDLEEQAARFKERYGRRDYAPRRAFQGQGEDIPQQLLMPDVHSPHLWMVRCKPGKEKDIVFALMRKFFDTEYSAQPLEISAAFSRESLKGCVYIECMRVANVQAALNGLNNVFASKLTLVPIKEMTDTLKVRHKESELRPGAWVRVKRGKYAMDLAQILDIADSGDTAKVKLIPRLDLTSRTDGSLLGGNKRKPINSALTARPPPKLFNIHTDKFDKSNKPISRGRGVFIWNNELFRDGFLEKDMKISSLITENINPTLDEVQKFAKGGVDDEDGGLDLSAVALSAMSASLTSHFQPGEKVEVTEGELKHVQGVVDSVTSDMIMVRASADDLKGSVLKFPPTQLRKLFQTGDHVKVVNGKYKDETGLIIKIEESVVTIVTDLNVKDIQVFSKDLQMAANVATGTGTIGQFETHDLIQLDASTQGVIYKVERGFARVLDQSGLTREVEPHLMQKRDSSRAIATDGEGNSIRDGDSVREIGGAMREGKILHLSRIFAFLYNREYMENSGVFVISTRLLVSMASKSRSQPGMRLDTMNPAMMNMNRGGFGGGGRGGRGGMMMGRGRGGRDPLVDKSVIIVRGPHKGYRGIVKDASDATARVELHTNCRIITVEKAKLAVTDANGGTTLVSSMSDMNPPSTPRSGYGGYGDYNGGMTPMRSGDMTPVHMSGSRTPAWNSAGSKTPAWNAGSKTPAWSSSSRTPNPYADGSRTPAWDAGSKTPRYGGGSSAWDSGSRTPAPGWDSGNRTPARGSAWGDSDSSSNHHNGGSSGSGSGYNAWNDKSDSNSGSGGFPQTPAASGDWMSRSVPTPGPFGAPSPAPFSSYPYTPGPSSSYDSAPTPSSNNFPSTPAASSSLGSGTGQGGLGSSNGGPSSVATPGAAPAASSARMQSVPTPGANQMPQTPAGGPTAPMTPASHFPQTPFMPTGGDYSSAGQISGYGSSTGGSQGSSGPSYDWATTDIEVKVSAGKDGSSFEGGQYNDQTGKMIKVPARNALSSMALCDVRLLSDGKVLQIPVQFLKPVAPLKNDGVKVLAGEHRGALGTLMGVDVQDGIVSLRGENMYKVLTMSVLGKHLAD